MYHFLQLNGDNQEHWSDCFSSFLWEEMFSLMNTKELQCRMDKQEKKTTLFLVRNAIKFVAD